MGAVRERLRIARERQVLARRFFLNAASIVVEAQPNGLAPFPSLDILINSVDYSTSVLERLINWGR
jgi:hypothetical protein